MKKYLWFKAKNYGWGWYPCSWEGWVVLLLYIVGLIGSSPNSESGTLFPFFIQTTVLTIFLIIICYKTGEKPEWRWGKKKTT